MSHLLRLSALCLVIQHAMHKTQQKGSRRSEKTHYEYTCEHEAGNLESVLRFHFTHDKRKGLLDAATPTFHQEADAIQIGRSVFRIRWLQMFRTEFVANPVYRRLRLDRPHSIALAYA